MNDRIFRVQDSEGRGPFRPGLSQYWSDDTDELRPPTWMEEFPNVRDLMTDPLHYGCGFDRPEQATLWFTESETHRLRLLGFRLVTMSVERILARSKHQLVFGRARPLRFGATALRWEIARAAYA